MKMFIKSSESALPSSHEVIQRSSSQNQFLSKNMSILESRREDSRGEVQWRPRNVLRLRHLFCAAGCGLVVAQVSAAELTPLPDVPLLPVVTGGIANSLIRGYDPGDRDSLLNRTFVQNYTSMIAVSSDGFLYTNTSWEEGHRPAGTYRNGDCLPDHPGFGTGSGWTVAVGERVVIYCHWGKVVIIERKPGQALDGEGGKNRREIVVSPEDKPPQITGLALDEARGRIWVATGDNGRVRCFTLEGAPVEITPINVPRAGGLALDYKGALWVLQTALPVGEKAIIGTVFADAAAEGHAAEFATETSDKAWYQAAGSNGSCGMEFPQATRLAGLKFVSAGEKSSFVGGKVEVSATGKDGPWTLVADIAFEPHGWPDTYVTLPSETPLKAVRVTAPQLGLRKLAVFAQVPAEAGSVLRFAADGKPLPQRITAVANPASISSDPAHQRLLIGAGRHEHQVLGFIGLDATPALDPSFGIKGRFGIAGGVYAGSGKEIGSIGSQRFDELRGAGTDAQGNLYVAMVGSMGIGQTRFESYDPQGTLRWRISGLSFIDAADLDPTDETSLWSASSRYRLDHSKPAGSDWTHVAATVDTRYSADARANAFTQQIFGMRRIHGQLFLVSTVAVNEFAFHRFDPAKSGDIGIPCAVFRAWHSGAAWPAHQPVGNTGWIWQDANGDGRTAANEFSKDPEVGIRSLGWVDDVGNHWSFDNRSTSIKRLTVAPKLDAFGSPQWSYANPDNKSYPLPEPFVGGSVNAVRVSDGDGPVYVCGFTKDLPNALGGNVPMGRMLVRYEQKDGALVETARATLPYDVHFGTEWVKETRDQAAAISLAGDYVFVGYQRTMNTLVYRADTLALVGRIDLGQQVHSPLIDGPAQMIARKRTSTNEYRLFYPMYVGNATTLVRWSPDATGYLAAPTALKHTGTNRLTWQASAGATGYHIERQDLGPAGWSAWQSAGETKTTAWKDAKAPKAEGHAWRIRALGATPSDWTFSVFHRE